MTERRSKRPTTPPTAKSGEHPAVQTYRAKLESIDEGAAAAQNKLDHDLEEFLKDLRTPVPPRPDATSTKRGPTKT